MLVGGGKTGYVDAMRAAAPTRLVSLFLLVGSMLASTAYAGDYDRNEVAGRSIGLLVGSAPIDNRPLTIMVQGAARKQNRWLTLGTQIALGAHFDGHVVVMAGGVAGIESTSSDWTLLRGYLELGANIFYAGSRLGDTLVFHVEGGLRLKLRAFARPHLSLQLGLRGMSNFNRFGWLVPIGLHWTFD
ncbi:MAG: hypothetical protein RIT45_2906 [Pseudomonadota bacterium]